MNWLTLHVKAMKYHKTVLGTQHAFYRGHFKIPEQPVVEKLFNPFTPKSDLIDFTLSNARRFVKARPLGSERVTVIRKHKRV